jgi:hypothetical protein
MPVVFNFGVQPNIGHTWQIVTSAPAAISGKWVSTNDIAEPLKVFRLAK